VQLRGGEIAELGGGDAGQAGGGDGGEPVEVRPVSWVVVSAPRSVEVSPLASNVVVSAAI